MSTEFGRRLREARKERGLTQGQLARTLGMSQGTLSELEREAYSSTRGADLARELGVRAEWLLSGTGPKHEAGTAAAPPPPPMLVSEDAPSAPYPTGRATRTPSVTEALATLAGVLSALPAEQASEVGHLLNAFATARGDSRYIPLLDAKLTPQHGRHKRTA